MTKTYSLLCPNLDCLLSLLTLFFRLSRLLLFYVVLVLVLVLSFFLLAGRFGLKEISLRKGN
jgi:hypothetical protein